MIEYSLIDVFSLPFMWRALATVVILALAAGVVGLGISFRELEFMSDALVHAVFPGLVIGAMVGGASLMLPGALVAALIAAVLFTTLGRKATGGRAGSGAGAGGGSDAAMAVVLTALFSLGVVLVSKQHGFNQQLQELLFGRLLTVTPTQLVQVAVVAAIATVLVAVTLRRQLFRSFDPPGFEAAGFSVYATDLTLSTAIALLVVAGVQALGVLMVVALLTVPLAIARLVSLRVRALVPIAIVATLAAGVGGLWWSFKFSVELDLNVSPGATVVLFLIAIYAVALGYRLARRSS